MNSVAHEQLICLSYNEWIVLKSINSGLKLKCFQRIFPIVDIKYSKNPKVNYHRLKALLSNVRRLNLPIESLAGVHIYTSLKKITRQISYISRQDYNFSFYDARPYQEVFKFKEARNDRYVISLDFNSMFPSLLLGEFADPRALKLRKVDQELEKVDLRPGLYNVSLSGAKTEFIKKHHPFRVNNIHFSNTFDIEDEDEIHTLLFKEEIEYYSTHFEKIYVKESCTSENAISHPLGNSVPKIFVKRQGSEGYKKDFLKFEMATLHASTNPRKFRTKHFQNLNQVISFFTEELGINLPKNNLDSLATLSSLLGSINLGHVRESDHGIIVR